MEVTLLHSARTLLRAVMTSGRVSRDTKVKSSFCSRKGYLGILTSPAEVGGKSQHQTCLGHTENRTYLECLMEGTQPLPSQESHFIPRIKLFLL